MMVARREFIVKAAAAGAVAVGMMAGLAAPACALSTDAATAHVRATLDELLALVNSPGDADSKAPRLQAIMEARAAMPQIARFAAGVVWREMNEDQQARFVTAFKRYLAVIYARRFQEYSGAVGAGGPSYTMDGVVDAGNKGILVRTLIARQEGGPVQVEWLVTDRPGRTVIADIVIESVSLLITQREEIGGMFEARGQDVEKLIADLAA